MELCTYTQVHSLRAGRIKSIISTEYSVHCKDELLPVSGESNHVVGGAATAID